MSLLERIEAGQWTEAETAALWADDREQFLRLASRATLADALFHIYFRGEWLADPTLIASIHRSNFGVLVTDWFLERVSGPGMSLHDRLVHGYGSGPLADERLQVMENPWGILGNERRLWSIRTMIHNYGVTQLLLFMRLPDTYRIDHSFLDVLCDLELIRFGDTRIQPFCTRLWRQLPPPTRQKVMVHTRDDPRDTFICRLIREELMDHRARAAWKRSGMQRFLAAKQGNDVANLIRSMLVAQHTSKKRPLEEAETSEAKRQKR